MKHLWLLFYGALPLEVFSSVVFCLVGTSIFVFQHSRRSSAHGTLTKLGKMKRKCVLESKKNVNWCNYQCCCQNGEKGWWNHNILTGVQYFSAHGVYKINYLQSNILLANIPKTNVRAKLNWLQTTDFCIILIMFYSICLHGLHLFVKKWEDWAFIS